VLIDLAENLFTHMRMIRRKTIVEKDRADRSMRDHMNIIEALESRRLTAAEELVRDHALGLADHVARFATIWIKRDPMAEAAVKTNPVAGEEREQTDGFNLIIDALKLNGLTTIYGVPGIPITDFGRMAQAAGIRVLSFRHDKTPAMPPRSPAS